MANRPQSLLCEILQKCSGKAWSEVDQYVKQTYDLDLTKNLTVPMRVLQVFDNNDEEINSESSSDEETEELKVTKELEKRMFTRGPGVDFFLITCKVCSARLRPQSFWYHIMTNHKEVAQNYKRTRTKCKRIMTNNDTTVSNDIKSEIIEKKFTPLTSIKNEKSDNYMNYNLTNVDPEPPEKLLLEDDESHSDLDAVNITTFSSITPSKPKSPLIKNEIKKESIVEKNEAFSLSNYRASHSTVAAILSSRKINSSSNVKVLNNQQINDKPKPKTTKLLPCKDRQFDADKHCGVWLEEQKRPCTRSLTCKTHALSLRRAVPGRSKSFNQLLQEHRDERNKAKQGIPTVDNQHQVSKKPHSLSSPQQQAYISLSPGTKSYRPLLKKSMPTTKTLKHKQSNDTGDDSENECFIDHPAYPLATNNWHCTNSEKGSRILSRSTLLFRSALKSIMEPKPIKPIVSNTLTTNNVVIQPSISLTSTHNFLITNNNNSNNNNNCIKVKDSIAKIHQPPSKKLCVDVSNIIMSNTMEPPNDQTTRQIGIAQKLPSNTGTTLLHFNGAGINSLKRRKSSTESKNNITTTVSVNNNRISPNKGVNIVVASVDQIVGLQPAQWSNFLKQCNLKQAVPPNQQINDSSVPQVISNGPSSTRPISIVNAQKLQKITPHSQHLTAQIIAAAQQQQQRQHISQSNTINYQPKILARTRNDNLQPLSLTIPIVQPSPNRSLLVQNDDNSNTLQNNTIS